MPERAQSSGASTHFTCQHAKKEKKRKEKEDKIPSNL